MNSVKVTMFRGLPKLNDKLQELYTKFYDGEVILTIEKAPLSRTLAQNKYYRAVIVPYFFKMWKIKIDGINENIAHEMIKRNFLSFEITNAEDKVITLYKSTKTLNTKEMSELIDACRGYYRYNMGEEIPLPMYMLENN